MNRMKQLGKLLQNAKYVEINGNAFTLVERDPLLQKKASIEGMIYHNQ